VWGDRDVNGSEGPIVSVRERAQLAAVREVLDAALFTAEAVEAAVGEREELTLSPDRLPFYASSLNAEPPLRELVRLFVLGEALELCAAARAVAPVDSDVLVELRLASIERGHLRPLVHVVPFRDVIVVHDLVVQPLAHDHVLGISPSSRVLASLALRHEVEAALDVGSGCGVHAARAARHSSRVVATDLNLRAVRLTALTACLSGVEVDARVGDLLEPAGGSVFDLILANPPFVISPDRAHLFRDGGRPGDEISKATVEQAAARLREGGFAQIMANWISSPDDWSARPRAWVADSGCDAWILRFDRREPSEYARRFLYPPGPLDPGYAEAVGRWLEYYRREGIEEISGGMVVLRRRRGRSWVRADELSAVTSSMGDQLLQLFAAVDEVEALPDPRALLHWHLGLLAEHRLDQTLLFRGGRYEAGPASLRPAVGVGIAASVPALELPVLFQLDGTRPLGDVLEDVCRQTGQDPADGVPALLATVCNLYERGFLTRV
jgi:methylase of polypeptide subunit release factors